MPIDQKRKDYLLNYAKKKYKRIPLDLPLEKYEELKSICEQNQESINGFIKKAIDARIQELNFD